MSKTPCSSIDFLGRLPDLRPERQKFPAVFPASREFGRRERFASDCTIRQPVAILEILRSSRRNSVRLRLHSGATRGIPGVVP
jgi:hypothetical protein